MQVNRMSLVAVAFASLAGLSSIVNADLSGTTFNGSLTHGGAPITFIATYGTPLTVPNPFRPETTFAVMTPFVGSPPPAFTNSILLNFQNFAYSDFPGQTGVLTLANFAEAIDPATLTLRTRNGAALGSISGGGTTISASWPVNAVNAGGVGVVISWNSIPGPCPFALVVGTGIALRRRRTGA